MNDNVNPTQTLAHATPETAKQVAGRRSFFTYLDLGVTDASNGAMRAQVTKATQGLGNRPAGTTISAISNWFTC
jgi:hypothetical protein